MYGSARSPLPCGRFSDRERDFMPEFSSVTGKGFICKCKKNGKVADRDLLTFARNRFLKNAVFLCDACNQFFVLIGFRFQRICATLEKQFVPCIAIVIAEPDKFPVAARKLRSQG